jgi:hypothetical protein
MKKILPIALSVLLFFEACDKWENRGQWVKTNIIDFDPSFSTISYTDTTIEAGTNGPFEGVYFAVATRFTGPGKYLVTNFSERLSSAPVYMAGRVAGNPPAGTVTIDYFGPVGDYVIGSFLVPTHMTAEDTSAASVVNVYGTFQVRRTR